MKRTRKGYIVVIMDDEGHIVDTPFASFDRGLAEEIALEYAYELMWREWYWNVHSNDSHMTCGWTSAVYRFKLTDYEIFVKEINWHE